MGGSSTSYSSSADYNFGSSKNVTRKSARDYAKDDGRTYTPSSVGLPSIKGKDISSDSELVVTVLLDVTGSMKEIPRMFIEKMPTLYAEANSAIQGKKLKELESGDNLEDKLDIGIVAIGDAACDSTPFQVLPYCHGAKLVKGVQGIFPEGGGGGNLEESYDLGAYFLLNHSNSPNIPKGNKPILIIAGDEGFYDKTNTSWVKEYIGDKLPKDPDTVKVLEAVKEKFDTYVLRPEISYSASEYAEIQKQWEDIFGPQRVMRMKDYNRLVDCIIGVCGFAANNFKASEELLRRRQTDGQVSEVLETLHPLLASKKKSATKKTASKKASAGRNEK